jgi:hypothetical protein
MCYTEHMRDVGEYLRAYWAYVSTHLGWSKALLLALVWLAVMFAPLTAKMFVELPNAVAIPWMIGWAFLSYIFAPYGMWKAQRKK